MPGSGAQAISRAPAADAQLAALFIGYEPMIGLLFLRSADVARDGLPDHRNPPVRMAMNGRPFPAAISGQCRYGRRFWAALLFSSLRGR
jgi:hypothetical protein